VRARVGLIGLVVALASLAGWTSIRPSNSREWASDQAVLARAEIAGSTVRIHDLRNFEPTPDGVSTPAYDDRVYDLDRITSVWYVLTPFSKDWRGPAHAFLSFGFDDGQFVAISVEARRERGEEYSVWKGALKRYEILYVIGDERDMIGMRALRGDDVYLYPVRATREQVRSLFVAMLDRANELYRKPQFYGSFRNNCTTSILRHVNAIANPKIRYGPRILMPGYSDAIALERGLIDTDLSLEAARARFRVTDLAVANIERADFSQEIRASR
jgi:hypothetical protein